MRTAGWIAVILTIALGACAPAEEPSEAYGTGEPDEQISYEGFESGEVEAESSDEESAEDPNPPEEP